MTASDPMPDEPAARSEAQSFMDDLAAPEPEREHRGFSLASLFLLLTAAAVISALGRNLTSTKIDLTWINIHFAVGAIIGGIGGAIIGIGYPRPVSSGLLGCFVGGLTGGICAATAASGGSPWLFVVGGAALVALGLASRWMHQPR